ncbi:hypothetical protein BX616_002935 [Lobosporangium transversale]|uniref:Uncharacterized protein n=1 Tax=Lobosporangium transversale TaxID=64571 RepID=A0A1Y2GNC3_9FUNG|nr:hypothetical protein BCR41DRAFT_386877 [Lobosporangium transversale]KAF9899598.1 hypothetical protein BX616_002935 [Lobosporangium transversale]ORZ14306.1 hypothetical protein BCR41DRAFT_386877 [Lobosporangium transversale]|eukprot:XP_021880784.1 hypothetical protein BCR41DRAFT_386877 [Lobosporangium transversale]
MTTPQPQQQDRPSTASSAPTSPTLPAVSASLNLSKLSEENSAFYSEPTFDDKKKMPSLALSPTQEKAIDIPDTKPAPVDTSSKQSEPSASASSANPAAPTALVAPTTTTAVTTTTATKEAGTPTVDVPSNPLSAPAPNPISPVANTASEAAPVLNIFSTVTEEFDTDVDMVESKDGPSSVDISVGSTTDKSEPKENGASAVGVEVKARDDRIVELETLNNSLRNDLDELSQEKQSVDLELNRTRGAYHELHRQHMDLQQKLAKRDRDYEVMSKNYLEHVRLIRATDDDHSTIMDRLTQLKASIEHLIRKAQGGRSVNLNREAAVEHFKNSGLLDNFPIPEDKLESFHLNLYMESVVMTTLVSCFFDKSLNCIFDYNKGFKEIYDWMYQRNEKLAVRWRQQLCVMLTQDPATKARQEEEVTTAANALSELVSKVYTNANELNKIKDICNKAFELSIAMTGLESVISPVTIPLGAPFDEESMGTSLKSNPEGKVALVIFPAFRDKECAFDVRPKVWCY